MYTVAKWFSFEASHQLRGLPDTHPCSRLHGHSYRVKLVLSSEQLDTRGFVLDFNEFRSFSDYIDENLDHRNLEDVLDFNTTSENLARFLFDMAVVMFGNKVVSCLVSETQKTWAEYRP